MVKLFFYNTNAFYSQIESARLVLDTEGKTLRLKCYQGDMVFLDDTATGTDRSGVQVITLWATNPSPPPPSVVAAAVTCEIYDTLNTLLERRVLWYYYGTQKRIIYFRDENGTPIGMNYCLFSPGPIPEQSLYDCGYRTYVADPYGSAALSYIEAYDVFLGAKRYWIGRNLDLAPVDSDVALVVPKLDGKAIVRIKYRLDNAVLNTIFKVPVFQWVVSFFLNNTSVILNNALYMARVVSEQVGIRLPIANARAYVEDGVVKLEVDYEQDLAPIIIVLIAAGIGGFALGLFFSGAIERITYLIGQTIVYAAYEVYLTQRANVLNNALDYCKQNNNADCVRQVTDALAHPDPPPQVQPPPPSPSPVPWLLLGAGAGILGLSLLGRRGGERKG